MERGLQAESLTGLLTAMPSNRPKHLDVDAHCTWGEIADSLGVTRQRAQQIAVSGLRKIALILRRRGVKNLSDILPNL
mgnify:CR=1 FL=1